MANITTEKQEPKIKILDYSVHGSCIDISYCTGMDGFHEAKLTEHDIESLVPVSARTTETPSSFNPVTGDIRWQVDIIPIDDFLDRYSDMVVDIWKDREELNLKTQ